MYDSLKWILISVGTALFTACFQSATGTDMPSDETVKNQWMKIGDRSVIYGLRLPPDYDPSGEAVPLIIALHYGGTPTTDYGKDFLELLIVPGLGQIKGIMAAPVISKTGSWQYPENVEMVLALTDSLIQKYHVDTSRVVITGYSLGAIGAWYFAAFYGKRFSAAIAVSGLPDQNIVNGFKQSNVPLYAIHSADDELFPLSDLEGIIQKLKNLDKDVTLKKVEGLSHYDTADFSGPLQTAVPWLQARWSGQ